MALLAPGIACDLAGRKAVSITGHCHCKDIAIERLDRLVRTIDDDKPGSAWQNGKPPKTAVRMPHDQLRRTIDRDALHSAIRAEFRCPTDRAGEPVRTGISNRLRRTAASGKYNQNRQ